MRTHGTLIKWNDDRGFGFISPAQGMSEVFVHISAFPRDGSRPVLNELVSYETETTHDGKVRAVRIMRAGEQTIPHRNRAHRRDENSGTFVGKLFPILVILAIGVYGYSRIQQTGDSPLLPSSRSIESRTPRPSQTIDHPSTASSDSHSSFTCDGRTTCSQMTSCTEARYFLENCPGTQMDGNRDGDPCERQWCNVNRDYDAFP